MKKEIIIDSYGLGCAAVVLERDKIIDSFIDPPQGVSFYPPNTFVQAKIDRRALNMGGYFVNLPNGSQGFLKSKKKVNAGETVLILSRAIFDLHKPQIFSDVLKTVSKYFVIKINKSGYCFSKKIPAYFDKQKASNILHAKIQNFDDVFIICRSSIAGITLDEFEKETEKAIKHLQTIKATLALKKIYFDGLARKATLEKYCANFYNVIEQDGIFERLGIWDQLEKIKNGRIQLNMGSYLIFEQTSAFLTIDVNSGIDFKSTKEEINLSACNEINRIIRVCGLGGKILIDFLPCSQVSRRKIYRKISDYFSKDTEKNKIWGWTKSGIFELERTRDKIPLKLLI